MSFGVDYAMFPHPSVAALKTAGVKFVCRYVSPEPANDANGKNLTPGECKALKGAGFSIVLVYEPFSANWMLGGRAAGVQAARDFDAVAKALGLDGIIMYAAADFDATPQEQTAINDCLDGIISVLGLHRTGLYGDFYVISRALAAGKCAYTWQTAAWSGGQWNSNDVMKQGSPIYIGGCEVDANAATGPDYGQWPRPVKEPAPRHGFRYVIPQGFAMSLDQLAANRGTTVISLVNITNTYANAGQRAILSAYLDLRSALLAAGGSAPALPPGMAIYTWNRW